MKRHNSIIALLLTFAMLIGMFTIGFAEDGAIDEGTTAAAAAEGETFTGEGSDGTEGDETTTAQAEEDTQNEENNDGKAESGSSPKKFNFFSMFMNDGIPTLTSKTFIKIVDTLRMIKYIFTGRLLTGAPKHLDVTVDEDVIAVCEAISGQSALDVYALLTNMPDLSDPARVAGKVFQLDVTEYREKMYEARDNYYSEGNSAMSNICWLLGAYMSGIESANVRLEPKNDFYQIALDVTYSDGSVEVFYPEIYINPETGECFGPDDKGMMNIGFNCNAYEAVVYAPMYCWMRNFGFCVEYDMLCYALPIYCYNTRRFKFEYDNRDWMIQIWKGNYLITNGGEVGIYNRENGKFGSYYDVVKDEEMLPMSLQIRHDDEVLVNIPEQNHWWVNGFKLGHRLYSPHTLQMSFTIEMPDEEMLKAFTAAIDKNVYHDVTYTVDGLKVTAEWDS